MSWHEVIFVMIALSIISDMNKPKEPKPPKADDLFFGRERRAAAAAENRARRIAAVKRRRQMVAGWFRGPQPWRSFFLITIGTVVVLVPLLVLFGSR